MFLFSERELTFAICRRPSVCRLSVCLLSSVAFVHLIQAIGKTNLSWNSNNAVAEDRGLKFLYDADLRHVESSVRCHRKHKNGRIKVDLG